MREKYEEYPLKSSSKYKFSVQENQSICPTNLLYESVHYEELIIAEEALANRHKKAAFDIGWISVILGLIVLLYLIAAIVLAKVKYPKSEKLLSMIGLSASCAVILAAIIIFAVCGSFVAAIGFGVCIFDMAICIFFIAIESRNQGKDVVTTEDFVEAGKCIAKGTTKACKK